jgi:hypothetical protein
MRACAGVVRAIPPGDEMVRTARGIGIAFGDEDVRPLDADQAGTAVTAAAAARPGAGAGAGTGAPAGAVRA